jgi:cytochrome c553
MHKFILITALILALVLLLAACGGDSATDGDDEGNGGPVTGDAARGEELYQQTAAGAASAPGCITCHSLEAGFQLVGPSHAGLAIVAGTRVSGQSAEEYLRESIVNPDAAVTEGFSEGVMYKNYGNELTDQEIADLVAFLLTLK